MAAKTINPSVQSLAQLRAAPAKLRHAGAVLPDDLEAEVDAFFATPVAAVERDAALAWLQRARDVAERVAAFAEGEAHGATARKLDLGDVASVRRVRLEEPQRRAEQSIAAMKSRFAGEREVWRGRLTVQIGNLNDEIERTLRSLKQTDTQESEADGKVTVSLNASWLESFVKWKVSALRGWADHVARLLNERLAELVSADLDALRDVIGRTSVVPSPSVKLPTFEPKGADPPRESYPRVSGIESFTTVYRSWGGIASMAGAGAGIVVAAAMPSRAMGLRVTVSMVSVAAAMIAALFSVRRRTRTTLDERRVKAIDGLRKTLAAGFKADVDRFQVLINRFVGDFSTAYQNQLADSMSGLVTDEFQKRREQLPAETSKLQLTLDELSDRITQLRQIKNGLTGTVLVDLHVKRREVEALPSE